PEIQQALAASQLGILLVSNHFLTSSYIKTHELPFLLRQAERGKLKLGVLYVSTVAKAALSIAIEIDGKPHTVNLADIIGVNSPDQPLDRMSSGERNALYARAADWAVRQLTSIPSPSVSSMPGRTDKTVAPAMNPMLLKSLPGPIRITFCQRLGEDWANLAVYFNIPPDRQRGFTRGRECHDILAWLEERDWLRRLPEGLDGIGRADLVEFLNQAS
ncbi:MAG: hypothetical protein KDI50_05820, partial [Candidatus Competibacteraceae bacterium]|nr:hypothetical protein [Candidatus Competibacteraceae bacterium]